MSKYQEQPLGWLLTLPERTLRRLQELENEPKASRESQRSDAARAAKTRRNQLDEGAQLAARHTSDGGRTRRSRVRYEGSRRAD